MAKFLCAGLPERSTDWSKWRVFFCDERHVGFDDPECTYSIYKRDLMSKVALSEDHVFPDNPNVSGIARFQVYKIYCASKVVIHGFSIFITCTQLFADTSQ